MTASILPAVVFLISLQRDVIDATGPVRFGIRWKIDSMPKVAGLSSRLFIERNLLTQKKSSEHDEQSLMLAGSEFQSLGRAIVKEDEYEEVRWDECDRTFVSRPGGPQNGTFTAPSFVNPAGHSRQCIYTFLAGQRQRVELVFTSFNLRGTPPE
ncbi:hypothetical protein ANN_16337 [Periplaneta americana]|uniref:CUB domain-containing protein n=1 Tax=Periplaneta americana TaxID=6978 RepID=A0ABQ8SJ53_PERAM|nr:hypothetical protein ANN_16337 [Periplaneta americana]